MSDERRPQSGVDGLPPQSQSDADERWLDGQMEGLGGWSEPAYDGPEPPRSGAFDSILAHMKGEPVAALPLPAKLRAMLAIVGVVAAAVIVLLLGVRPDFSEQPVTLVLIPALLLAAGFSAGLGFFDGQANRTTLIKSFGIAVVGVILFVVVSLLIGPTDHSMPAGDEFLAHAFHCNAAGLAVALCALVPAVVLARRNMAGPSRLSAVALGLLAGCLAVGALQVRCGLVDQSHVFFGHGAVFVLGVGVALLLRRVKRLS